MTITSHAGQVRASVDQFHNHHHRFPTACTNDLGVLAASVCSSYLSILLCCVPLGVMAYVLKWSPLLVFSFNFLALIPLALLLGEITGALAQTLCVERCLCEAANIQLS